MKQISIVIVTYNSEKDIYDCVRSIQTHADIPLSDIELIVADNNSRDTDTMFSNLHELWGEDIITLRNTRNGGYGQGNNIGIRHATAPVVLIMNPDVRMMEPCLGNAVNAFATDSSLIMYGMKQMLTPDTPSTYPFGTTMMMCGYLRPIIMAIASRLDLYMPKFMYLDGSCFFVRKSMFAEVGLFDEENFLYAEEDDIHYRLTKRFGYNIRYDKNIRYMHLASERKPDVNYELMRARASVFLNNKKGYPQYKTVRNFIAMNRVLLWREQFRELLGHRSATRPMLTELIDKLKKLNSNDE